MKILYYILKTETVCWDLPARQRLFTFLHFGGEKKKIPELYLVTLPRFTGSTAEALQRCIEELHMTLYLSGFAS